MTTDIRSTAEAAPDDGLSPDPTLPPTAVPESALTPRWTWQKIALWTGIALLGGVAWVMLALVRGETVNAIWFVFAAVCTYLIGYRFYSKVIERYITRPDDRRATPAEVRSDGKDYVPTDRRVLFGHHFAAIAGAGPLVGPVLAAQMGYLPGTIWIIVGVIFAGAVQDYVVLFFSMRRGGRTIGQMARQELGRIGGTAAIVASLLIMLIIVAILALVVVNALGESPWGVFSVAMTIPIALFMGVYLRYLRPGRITEVSIIGFVLLMAAIVGGGWVANTTWGAELFHLDRTTIAIGHHHLRLHRRGAARVAAPRPARLPVDLHEDRRDRDARGCDRARASRDLGPRGQRVRERRAGPVFAGSLFPFLFVTIACGALSGFHALIASGTTPKLHREGASDALHRLRRHAHGVVRRDHGARRSDLDRPRHLLRHERLGRCDGRDHRGRGRIRQLARPGRREPHARHAHLDRRSRRGGVHRLPHGWRPDPGARPGAHHAAAVRRRVDDGASGTTSRSCSRRCSSSRPSTPGRASRASCSRTRSATSSRSSGTWRGAPACGSAPRSWSRGGEHPLPRGDRPPRRDQHVLPAVRHRQPAPRSHRARGRPGDRGQARTVVLPLAVDRRGCRSRSPRS